MTKICIRCESLLDNKSRCTDNSCAFMDYDQDDARGFANHPDCVNILNTLAEQKIEMRNVSQAINH